MVIPMVIMATVFIIILGVVALVTHNFCFGLFLVPMLAVLGIIITAVVLMPVWARRMARQTLYALSNQRVITLQKGPFALHVRSFAREHLGNMQRTERPDGTGDLVFAQVHSHDFDGHHQVRSIGLHGLDRVHEVEELIRATLLAPPVQAGAEGELRHPTDQA